MLQELEHVPTLPTIRLGLRLILLTMVRKSELLEATWDEVDFENAVWSIPKERMKRGKPHNVYLSQQSLDIMIALKTCAANSRYVLPSRYDADETMSKATFNRITMAIIERAKKKGLALQPFTVHDLRRTGSTLLHELGFNSDWTSMFVEHGLAPRKRIAPQSNRHRGACSVDCKSITPRPEAKGTPSKAFALWSVAWRFIPRSYQKLTCPSPRTCQ